MLLRKSILLSLPALVRSVDAQSATTTSSAPITTHTVAVGEAGLTFTPKIIQANISDVVEFRFYPQNHSVARAEYRYACIPYEYTGVNKVGFWSGFHPVNVVLPDPPKFSVRINDTSPIFFYCSAPGACINDGMIGVINPNETETFDTQQAFAKNSTLAFSPGEGFPSEHDSSISSSTSLPTSTSIFSSTPTSSQIFTPTSSATATAAAGSDSRPALSTGEIIGIAIGAAAVVLLIGCLFYLCGRARTLSQFLNNQHQSQVLSPCSFSPTSHMSEKPRPGDVSSAGFYGGHSDSGNRSQTQSPPLMDEEIREYTPMPFGHRDGPRSAQTFRQSVQSNGRIGVDSGSPMMDPYRSMSPNDGYADAINGVVPIPEALRVNRPHIGGPGPHELAVPSRNPSLSPTSQRQFSPRENQNVPLPEQERLQSYD